MSIADIMKYKTVEVIRVTRLTETTFKMYLRWDEKPPVGTFFMVWLQGYEAIPLSVSGWYNGALRFIVQIRGKTTAALFHAKRVGLLGPLGREVPPPLSKPTLVAGGIGIAPLLYMWEEWGGKLLYGARSAKHLIPIDGAIIATDDGSAGMKGTVVDMLLNEGVRRDVYACGPIAMMRNLGKISRKLNIKGYGSTEVPVKCGMGICGSCVIGGKLLCKDPWLPLWKYAEV